MVDLEFRFGNEITSEEDFSVLAAMLNEEWENMIRISPQDLKSRLANAQKQIVVAYSKITKEDIDYVSAKYGLTYSNKMIPVAIAETRSIFTGGDLGRIPKNYFDLTNKGVWAASNESDDTVIAVDITTLPTRKGDKGNGEATRLMKHILGHVAYNCNAIKHIFTYTPDIQGLINWHIKLGAVDTGYKIYGARPGYGTPDVNVMDYSSLIKQLRSA